jgi:mRNA interferase MazF
VQIDRRSTRVLAEQTAAVDPGRLGNSAGYLSLQEMRRVDAALRIMFEL